MMIGDALRGEYLLFRDFSQRVTHHLAQEPTVLAPRRSAVKRITVYALSAAASLSAIALLGWIAFFINPLTPQPEIAEAPNIYPPAAAPSTQLASVPSDRKEKRQVADISVNVFGADTDDLNTPRLAIYLLAT